MELKQYIAIVRRWAWILILGLVLGTAGGFAASYYQTPVYQASTRLLITRAAAQAATSDLAYLNDQQLAQTYIQLLTTQPVLDQASAVLGYPIQKNQLRVQQIGSTQVVQLTAEDTDPARTTNIANALIQALIDQNETLQSGRYASTEESLQAQIDQVQSQINNLQAQISNVSSEEVKDQLTQVKSQIDSLQAQVLALQDEVAKLKRMYPTVENKASLATKQAQLAQIEPVLALYQQIYTNLVVLGKPAEGQQVNSIRLSQLEKMLSLYQEIYINLLTSIESVRLARLQNTPNVVQIEAAALPSEPIRPKPVQNTLLAAALGLMLAAGIVFLIEYLDDTIKTVDDVERNLQLPVIGYIAKMQYGSDKDERLYVVRQPRSPVAEAFRSLRTNLEFSSVDKPLRRLLVTSPSPNDGKTTIAANLSAIMAQGGKRVILLDADMRKPQVHRFLGVSNRVGLSDIFRGSIPISMTLQTSDRAKDVTVVTSGSLPPNPTELLASDRMDQILHELGERGDMVVIDGPPSLVADVQVLASKVDGVVMVIQPGHTHADEARATLEQLARTGVRVLGVIFNRIPRDRFYYYGGYRYYSPYHNNGYNYYASRESAERDEVQPEAQTAGPGFKLFSRTEGDQNRQPRRMRADEKNK